MSKKLRIIKVPKNYYHRVHETRYQKIFGSGAIFRQKEMNSYVARAWEEFCSICSIPKGSLGIEFGCGTGINVVTISFDGFKMTGLDISETAISKARELAKLHNSSTQFIVGDIFDSGLRSCLFDFALNIWTLHCVGEQDLRDKHLAECFRVLKHGGYIYLHNECSKQNILDPNEEIVIRESDQWNIAERTNLFDLPDGGKVEVSFPGHMPSGLNGRRSLEEHKKELQRAGFQILRCYEEFMSVPDPKIQGNHVMVAFAQKP